MRYKFKDSGLNPIPAIASRDSGLLSIVLSSLQRNSVNELLW